MAKDTFFNCVPIAERIKSNAPDIVFGVASKPLIANQDSFWKGVLFAMRGPAEAGLQVTNVNVRDMSGCRTICNRNRSVLNWKTVCGLCSSTWTQCTKAWRRIP